MGEENSDGKVSPIVGVVLMVAVTVVLAAIIGTFVLALGGMIFDSDGAENVGAWSVSYENSSTSGGVVEFTYRGDETVSASPLRSEGVGGAVDPVQIDDGNLESGDTIRIGLDSDVERVRLLYDGQMVVELVV